MSLEGKARQYILSNCKISLHEKHKAITDPHYFRWEDVAHIRVYTEKEPLCPICLETPYIPRMTDCGHYFCLYCIHKVFKTEKTTWISCPVCRTNTFNPDLLKRVTFTFLNKPVVGQEIDFHLMVKHPHNNCIRLAHIPSLFMYREIPDQEEKLAQFTLIDTQSDKAYIEDNKIDTRQAKKLKKKRSKVLRFLLNLELTEFYTHTFIDERGSFQKFFISEPNAEKYNLIHHNLNTSSTLFYQSDVYPNTYLTILQQNALFLGSPLTIPYFLQGTIINIKSWTINKGEYPNTPFLYIRNNSKVLLITVDTIRIKTPELLHPTSDLKIHLREMIRFERLDNTHKTYIANTQRSRLQQKDRLPTVFKSFQNQLTSVRPMSPFPSSSSIPYGYNTCTFGIECEDPDHSFPHDSSCKYYSISIKLDAATHNINTCMLGLHCTQSYNLWPHDLSCPFFDIFAPDAGASSFEEESYVGNRTQS